jgi:hypothetical protein
MSRWLRNAPGHLPSRYGCVLRLGRAAGQPGVARATGHRRRGEETFLHDTDDRGVLRACLRAQAADIAAALKRRHLAAHTVQVKVRYGDFTTLTRQLTVEEPVSEARDIYRLGCFLLGRESLVRRPLRLLGLGVSTLREPTGQQFILLQAAEWKQFPRTRHTHHPVDHAKGNAKALLHFQTLGLEMPA